MKAPVRAALRRALRAGPADCRRLLAPSQRPLWSRQHLTQARYISALQAVDMHGCCFTV